MSSVNFTSNGLNINGNLYLPNNINEGDKLLALVIVHPFTSIKEQSPASYSKLLAEQGFIAPAYDAAYQGESEGTPRFRENPYQRVEDIKAAITYLGLRLDVDTERIGILGICAGGGYASFAGSTDIRAKAVAGVSSVCIGRLNRNGLDNAQTPEGIKGLLKLAAHNCQGQAKGENLIYVPMLPKNKEDIKKKTDPFTKDLCGYYRISIGAHPNTQHLVEASSFDSILGYDSFASLLILATRPYLMIAGPRH